WNSVVDNNEEKSVSAQLTYNVQDRLTYQFLYFGGIERRPGAPEGRPWRNLFDSYVAWYPRAWLALLLHAAGGFESTHLGTDGWLGGALYGGARVRPWLYLAGRIDALGESVPSDATGKATPIFSPASWVASGTATIDIRPADNLSIRL